MTDEQLREAVAKAMWEAVCNVAQEYREVVWDRTYSGWENVLPDEDSDGFSWQGKLIGKNTFLELAAAAIALLRPVYRAEALDEAARVAENHTELEEPEA